MRSSDTYLYKSNYISNFYLATSWTQSFYLYELLMMMQS